MSVHPAVICDRPADNRTIDVGIINRAAAIVRRSVPGATAPLIEHATQREFVHRHSWRVGDLVIWDNRCTLHRRNQLDPSLRTQLTQLGVSLPPMADPETLGKLEAGASFDLEGSTLAVTDLHALLDDTRLSGTVAAAHFDPLALHFALEGDTIDFDRYLEPA